MLGDWVTAGEYDREAAYKLAGKIAYKNIKELAGV